MSHSKSTIQPKHLMRTDHTVNHGLQARLQVLHSRMSQRRCVASVFKLLGVKYYSLNDQYLHYNFMFAFGRIRAIRGPGFRVDK
jgi:hypothetical protein